jgi:hypothetical protein
MMVTTEGRVIATLMLLFIVTVVPAKLNDCNFEEDGKPGTMTVTTKIVVGHMGYDCEQVIPSLTDDRIVKKVFPTWSDVHYIVLKYYLLVGALKVKLHPMREQLLKAAPEKWKQLWAEWRTEIIKNPLTKNMLWESYLRNVHTVLGKALPQSWLKERELNLAIPLNKKCDHCAQVIVLHFLVFTNVPICFSISIIGYLRFWLWLFILQEDVLSAMPSIP